MNKLAPYNEAEWQYTLKTLPAVIAGKRVKGWHTTRVSKLPRTAQEAKLVRRVIGMSQKEMAALVGASLATVKAWESGARKPDGVATKVLRLLGHEPGLAKRFAKIVL